MLLRWVFAAAAFTAVVAGPRAARAHGAFPSPMALFTSPAAPSSVVVATNVGLFRSDDIGQTWRWQCEDAVAGTTSTYGVAADLQTTYALTETSVAASRAEECAFAPLPSGPGLPFHITPDAALPSRVWLLESESSLASFDGEGRRSRLTLPPASRLVSAYGAGAVVLATAVEEGTPGVLFDSSDGGETWRQRALPASVQSFGPVVLAVGPEPGLVLLRLIGVDGDRIARSTDGGATFQTSAELPGFMRGFARDERGNLYVGLDDVSTGRLVVLDVDLEITETLPLAFVPRGVAHHGGKLYVLTNTFDPPGPLLVSDDGGHTFRSALDTKRVTVAPACAATTTCQATCKGLVDFGLLAAGTCPWPPQHSPTVNPLPSPAPAATGCQLAPPAPSPGPLLLTIAALALLLLRARGLRLVGRCPPVAPMPKRPCLILIVDDDTDLSSTLKEFVEMLGYEAVCAENGQEAVALLQSRRPALVLVDLFMPVMGGIDFLHLMRSSPVLSDIPRVIMTSANDSMVGVKEDLSVLYKPFDLEALAETLRQFCGPAERAPSLP